MFKQWENFIDGQWNKEINVRNFIQKNYSLYDGEDNFLAEVSDKTKKVWSQCEELIIKEIEEGVLDIETKKISGVNNFEPGYIDKDNEVIVGLQTDKPLKRIVNLYGGTRMATSALEQYGYQLDEGILAAFNEIRKTHNEGVFDVYPERIRKARSAGLLTGLPDAYGRGRIIGDYRRIALYGMEFLIAEKQKDIENLDGDMDEERIRLIEEVSMQVKAMKEVVKMADTYGVDLRKPAENAKEAIQHIYMGYLAGTKENNGAATSLGRVSTFMDIFIERDIKLGKLSEKEAQELIDQFVIKLRLIRHLRTPEYNDLFGGDPTWITESIGGVSINGKPLVSKTSFRILHSLDNLGAAPEPNLTVLWSEKLPENFKKYCAKMSIRTDAIQYENDDVMRPIYGDDYGIACCVSAMALGKQMQFFGARANVAKSLLLAVNGGVDEIKGIKLIPGIKPLNGDVLDYKEVMENYIKVLEYVATLYKDAINIIHYMHDKYAYEASQMAFHDTKVERLTAFGFAGISAVADSLSAIKFAKVKPIRDENGIAKDFETVGSFPKYGNDIDDVDEIAVFVAETFSKALQSHKLYRDSIATLSALTITSNVMYGKKTGSMPDGRKLGEPLAPGANPMHGRDTMGALASLNSVAKLPYRNVCQDGVSNTFSITKKALGNCDDDRIDNLVDILDGYFMQGAQHLNVNVMNRQKLIDAVDNPDKYPTLTIRVSGYAVNFNRLTKEQKLEVISRTFHDGM